MKDLFGKAILDYQTNNFPEDIITQTSISDQDAMSIAYLFRDFELMPKIEQTALNLCYGKILDVGCGAGSHSLYLQNNGFDVTSIDISSNAIKTCQLRGLKNAKVVDILEIENQKFDTILMLMNGTGIFKTMNELNQYLSKLKSLLNPKGQILIDSSDIIYMYDTDSKGKSIIPKNQYYGELTFLLTYKRENEDEFPWLYLDFNLLKQKSVGLGLNCDLITNGDHYDYLAKLY